MSATHNLCNVKHNVQNKKSNYVMYKILEQTKVQKAEKLHYFPVIGQLGRTGTAAENIIMLCRTSDMTHVPLLQT